MRLYRTNLPGSFQARVNLAAAYISAGRPHSRAFDDCFEMHDGDFVATALWRRVQKRPNTNLAMNIHKYLGKARLEATANQFADVQDADLPARAQAHCEEVCRRFDAMMAERAARQAAA